METLKSGSEYVYTVEYVDRWNKFDKINTLLFIKMCFLVSLCK